MPEMIAMKKTVDDQKIAQSLRDFHLPRYEDLPSMGLYLEQTAKYLNRQLAPLEDVHLTASMISNYVKHDLIFPPNRKLYSRQQLAELTFIAISKNVLPLANLREALRIQRETYDTATAYNYMADELENVLAYVFGLKAQLAKTGKDHNEYKRMLRSVIMTVSYKVYLDKYFSEITPGNK